MCWPRSKSMSCPPKEPQVPVEGAGFIRRQPSETIELDFLVPRHEKDNWIKLLRIQGRAPGRRVGLRGEQGRPQATRLGIDTDERTIPHEVDWIGSAVHLDKGCYRGQETVARVHNPGKPRECWCCCTSTDPTPGLLPAIRSWPVDAPSAGWALSSTMDLGPIALALLQTRCSGGHRSC